jgi:hypothetical protein
MNFSLWTESIPAFRIAATPQDSARAAAADPVTRPPIESVSVRRFCSSGEVPSALWIISGAKSAHDFSTEQVFAPWGTRPNPAGGAMGFPCASAAKATSTTPAPAATTVWRLRCAQWLNEIPLFFQISSLIDSPPALFVAIIARFNLSVTNPSQTSDFVARESGRNLKFAKKMQGRGIFYPHYRNRCSLGLPHVVQSARLKMRRRNGISSAIRFLFGTTYTRSASPANGG